MFAINDVTITGTVVDQPKINTTNGTGTRVGNLRLRYAEQYTDSSGQQQESQLYFTCTAWKRQVDVLETLEIGDQVIVKGKLVLNQYETADGAKRSEIRVSAFQIHVMSRASESETVAEERPAPPAPKPTPPPPAPARGRRRQTVPASNGVGEDEIPY